MGAGVVKMTGGVVLPSVGGTETKEVYTLSHLVASSYAEAAPVYYCNTVNTINV